MARVRTGRITNALLFLILAALVVSQAVTAGATHQPANKVTAAGSKLAVMGPGTEVPILSGTLRTSSTSDLLLSVSLECSILTALITGPSGDGGSDMAKAVGDVKVWIEIDGEIVPVNGAAPGNDSDKVTFCNRAYQRTVTDAEDPQDGQDIEDDYIATKSANAFNWIALNLGNGVHDIVVKATLTEETVNDATAEAAIGNRTLVVEPTKLANDATI